MEMSAHLGTLNSATKTTQIDTHTVLYCSYCILYLVACNCLPFPLPRFKNGNLQVCVTPHTWKMEMSKTRLAKIIETGGDFFSN